MFYVMKKELSLWMNSLLHKLIREIYLKLFYE